MNDLAQGGGIVADISGVSKPAKYQPIIKRTRQYIEAMNYAKKPVTHVTLSASDYDGLFSAAKAHAKEQSTPDVIGLRFGQIPVKRA